MEVAHQERSSQGSNYELLASDCIVLQCATKLFGDRMLGVSVYLKTRFLQDAQLVVTCFLEWSPAWQTAGSHILSKCLTLLASMSSFSVAWQQRSSPAGHVGISERSFAMISCTTRAALLRRSPSSSSDVSDRLSSSYSFLHRRQLAPRSYLPNPHAWHLSVYHSGTVVEDSNLFREWCWNAKLVCPRLAFLEPLLGNQHRTHNTTGDTMDTKSTEQNIPSHPFSFSIQRPPVKGGGGEGFRLGKLEDCWLEWSGDRGECVWVLDVVHMRWFEFENVWGVSGFGRKGEEGREERWERERGAGEKGNEMEMTSGLNMGKEREQATVILNTDASLGEKEECGGRKRMWKKESLCVWAGYRSVERRHGRENVSANGRAWKMVFFQSNQEISPAIHLLKRHSKTQKLAVRCPAAISFDFSFVLSERFRHAKHR